MLRLVHPPGDRGADPHLNAPPRGLVQVTGSYIELQGNGANLLPFFCFLFYGIICTRETIHFYQHHRQTDTRDTTNTEIPREVDRMTEAAKEARRAYKREWNRRHPDKVKEAQARYWERKAAQAQQTDEPAQQEADS